MYHLITEEWNGSPITVRQEDAWWNLTEMCAAFGKRPVDFLRLPSTDAYHTALAAKLGLPPDTLVTTSRGGNQSKVRKSHFAPATWAHPFLAMECARWLSPEFSIRCNEVIIRILKGETIEGALLSPAQRRLRKQRLKLQSSELRVEIDSVRRQLDAIRRQEDLPGHVAIREWLAENGITLDQGSLVRLSVRLAAGARSGKFTSGEKTIATGTLARVQRAPTYEPQAIAAAYSSLFPPALTNG